MKRILCFAAHPDDLEFTCTGRVSRLIAEGYEAVYVIATNGENGFGNSGTPREERVRIRDREQRAAARAVGVKEVIFLHHRDGFLEYTEDLRRDLAALLKQFRPELVFSFDPANRAFDRLNLYHRDHRVMAEAVFDACFAAKNRFMYPGEAHKVEKICFFGTDQPNDFEDITDFIDRKLEILANHASQFPDFSRIVDYVKDIHSRRTEKFEHSEAYRVIEVIQVV